MRRKACPAPAANAHRRAGMGDVVSLAACPSALLLATTPALPGGDYGSAALGVRLQLYLSELILCFDNPRWYRRAIPSGSLRPHLFLTCRVDRHNTRASILLPVRSFFGCMHLPPANLCRVKPQCEPPDIVLFSSFRRCARGIFVGIIAPLCSSSSPSSKFSLGRYRRLACSCACFRDPTSWIFEQGVWVAGGHHGRRGPCRLTLAVSGAGSAAVARSITFLPICIVDAAPCRRSHVRDGKTKAFIPAGETTREARGARRATKVWPSAGYVGFSRTCRGCALSRARRFT